LPNSTDREVCQETRGNEAPHEFVVAEKEGHMSGRVDSLKKDVTTGVNYLKKTLGIQ
jgi:hypothetical protein